MSGNGAPDSTFALAFAVMYQSDLLLASDSDRDQLCPILPPYCATIGQLAEYWAHRGMRLATRDLLALALGWFRETYFMVDLDRANTLLSQIRL